MAAPAAPAASACVEDVRAGSTFTAASNAAGDGAPPPPAAAFDGNGNGGCDSHAGHMEEMMRMLIERMDRHTTGHYLRAYVPLDIANPAPLGFFAFSLTTCLFMVEENKLTEAATQFLAWPLGIFYGGLIMLIVAVLEIFRRNSLGAAAFGSYSAFFITIGVYGILQTTGTFFLQAPGGQKTLTAIFGVLSMGFMVVALVINLALPIVFFFIGVLFFLLAGGIANATCAKVAGWWGVVTAVLAFYIGLAMLIEEMWGREMLPLFYTKVYKRHAKMLFPRISEHDPLSISAGVPYPGRPEIRAGDNISALRVAPSLLSMRGGNAQPKRSEDMV